MVRTTIPLLLGLILAGGPVWGQSSDNPADEAEQPAPAPVPVPAPVPQPAPATSVPAKEKGPVLARMGLWAGAGQQREVALASGGYLDAHAWLGLDLGKGLSLQLGFRDRFYKKQYLSVNPDGAGGAARAIVGEQFQVAGLTFAGNLLKTVTQVVTLEPGLSLLYMHIDNESFSNWNGMLGLGLTLGLRPAEALWLRFGLRWAPRLFGQTLTLDAHGLPKFMWDFTGMAHITVSPKVEILAGYQGSSIVLEHEPRIYHGAVAGLSFRLN